VRGIGELRFFDLAYDLLIYPHQLPAAIQLVRKFPGQRFVLDHVAKPYIKRKELWPWAAHIGELAQCSNVFCKVSGMVTEADWSRWKKADFTPYLDVIFEAFTPRRIMFGSDWPVCLLSASYERVYDLAADYCQRLSSAEQGRVFGGHRPPSFTILSELSRPGTESGRVHLRTSDFKPVETRRGSGAHGVGKTLDR
jgi:L-fuconolactonase